MRTKQNPLDERGNLKSHTYSAVCYMKKCSRCKMPDCKCGCHIRNQETPTEDCFG